MHTLMIPVSPTTSRRMKAATSTAGLISLQSDPKHALNTTTKCSRLSMISAGYSSRALLAHQPTHLVTRCTSRTNLLSLHFPGPSNSNPYSTKRRGRGRGRAGAGTGTTDVRGSLGSSSSSPFPSTRGVSGSTLNVSATGTAAASPGGFSSDAEDPGEASPRQNARVLWSVSEKPSSMEATENSGEDGEEGLVQKTTTVFQAGGQEGERSEPLVLTEQEYTLTEEGTLSTVKVTRGGTTHRTDTEVARVLAEAGVQVESLQQKIQNFSVRKFIQEWGKKKPGLEDLKFNPNMYDPKDGVSNITQWTATELTLQRAQLVRIATDALYLVWAFSFFGGVRILEALLAVFATSPPNFMKLMEGMNAMDPLTVASLAHAVRKPIVGLLNVEPTDLEEVSSLKVKFLSELHKFYERQWKVVR